MRSRTLCSRHGVRSYAFASKHVEAGIKARGQFQSGKLVKISLDRRKHSKRAWVTWAELEAYLALVNVIDNVAHVTHFPAIAAIERSWVFVCPDCRDELLVRSGEPPESPTSVTQAFDTSAIAEAARVPDGTLACTIHGLVRSTRSSLLASEAIRTGSTLSNTSLIRILIAFPRSEQTHWFEADFLRRMLGENFSDASTTFRLDDAQQIDTLLMDANRVCPSCLRDLLKRSGIDQPTA